MKEFPKKHLLRAISLAVSLLSLSMFAGESTANTRYMRGTKKSPPHSVNRFQYTHPAYRARNPKPVRKCKAIGQARCLNPKPRAQPYARHPNGVRITDIHPLVRKVFKPSVKRYH